MTTTYPESISLTETANLIRGTLKRNFPGVKFSVRSSSFAGGSAVDIKWTDGPTEAGVDAITRAYAYGGFDGSIDLAYHVESWLNEDGSATLAYSPGTEASRGSVPEAIGSPTHGGARLVSFGAKFVSANRKLSPAFIARCGERATLNGRSDGRNQCHGCGNWIPAGDCWVAQYTDARDYERIDFACSQPCAGRTLARFTDAGAAVAS